MKHEVVILSNQLFADDILLPTCMNNTWCYDKVNAKFNKIITKALFLRNFKKLMRKR